LLSDSDPRGRRDVIANITTPRNYLFDFKINRSITLANSPLTAYIYIQNLLNRQNVQQVYRRTGTTDDDGSFDSRLREQIVESRGEEFFTLYQLINIDHRQEYAWGQGGDLFQRPREIRFGLQLEF